MFSIAQMIGTLASKGLTACNPLCTPDWLKRAHINGGNMKIEKLLFRGLRLVVGLMLFGAAPAIAAVHLIDVIPVPGRALTSFDISWVDGPSETYFLADRSNFGVDIYSAEDNTFITRLPGFAGPSTSNDTAGPNGVVEIHSLHQLWAGDGDSTVKVFDLRADPPRRIDVIHTGGEKRADEMAFDQRDHVLLVANDADDTPFVTFISTSSREVLGRIFFDGVQAHLATNGLEQPIWDPDTQLFYLSVPEINGNPATGEIAVIDPRTMAVVNAFPVSQCQPAGLAEGPFDNVLVGCANHDGVTFPPKLIVLDIRTGAVLANITQVGGADEVWFNEGDNRFYVAARDNPSGPVLGVIDAVTNTWIENVPTAFNAHSVAADRKNNHIFVPLRPPRAGQPDPNPCVAFGGSSFTGRGCIGVYAND